MARPVGLRAGWVDGGRGTRSRRGRLTRSADFDRVFRSGRSHAGREFVLYAFPREQDSPPRLGLSVSRKVGGAVQRNLVKRLLREAFAAEGSRLPAGIDVVIVARPEARTLAEREGLEGVQRELGALLARVERTAGAEGHGQVDGGSSPLAEAQRTSEPGGPA